MLSDEIKDYAFALRALDALRGEADEELRVRVRRLLEFKITQAEQGADRPPSAPNPTDDIPF